MEKDQEQEEVEEIVKFTLKYTGRRETRMKAKIIWVIALVALMSTYAVSAGDFRVLDTNLAELFEVTTAGIVSIQTALYVPTLVVNGTLFNATGAAAIDFSPDTILEGDILFATSCAAGNHLFINGNDLDCEADDILTEAEIEDFGFIKLANVSITDTNESTRFDLLAATDCAAGQLVIGVNATGGVLCAVDADTADTDTNVTEAIVQDWGFFYSEVNLTDLLDDNYAGIAVVDTDTNESVRFDLLAATDCAAGQLVIGVNATGGVLCAADDTGSGIADIVEDTTPRLGGNLDLNVFDIYNAGGGITNMTIDNSGNFIITIGS